MSGTFGRSVFEIRAGRAAFQTELSQAEKDAQDFARATDRTFQQLEDSLSAPIKKSADEFDRNLDATKRRAQEHSADIRSALGGIGGSLGGIVGAAGPLAAVVAGLVALTGAALAAGRAIQEVAGISFDYNRNLQNATNLLVAYTGSQERANQALALAQKEADAGRGAFGALANAISLLQPSARQSGESIEDLTQLMEILAATNPAEGIQGAAIALREAASGDFTSVAERFNVSRLAIQRLRDEGVGNIDAVRQALAEMGITFAVVEQQSRSVDVLQQRLTGLGQRFAGEAGAPVFVAFNDGLAALVDLLSDPRIATGSEKIANLFSTIGAGFDRGFAQDELTSAIDDLLDLLEDESFTEFGESLSDIAEFGGLAATGLVRVADAATAATAAVGGIENAAQLGLNALRALVPPIDNILRILDMAAAIGKVNKEIDELAKKQGILGEIGRALGGGRQEIREVQNTLSNPNMAIDPGTEAQFDINVNASDEAFRIAAGRQAQTYVNTFTSETAKHFTAARGVLADSLLAAVGGDEARVSAQQTADGFVLVARAMSEIQARGFVAAETISEIRRTFGETGEATIAYLEGVERLNAAQQAYDTTVRNLTDAQEELRDVTQEVKVANDQAAAAVRSAQDVQAANAAAARDAVDEQRQLIAGLQREAAETAQRYADITRALRDQADAAREAARAAQQARAEQIAAARDELTATQTLAREHAAAFAAIQNGTVDQFLAMNGEIDESTRKIIESYGAQASAAIAARNAAEGRADDIGVEGRRRLLDLETQIRAARGAGNFAEAAALERQRDLERQRFQSREAFARQQAAVAQDEVNAALKPIEAAAQAQAVADAAAERGAQAKLAALQAQDAAARASEEAAIAAIEKEIAAIQRMAEDEARRYKDRQQAIQDHIDDIEEAARIQAAADKKAVDDAKTLAEETRLAGIARITAAQDAVGLAEKERDAARDTLQFQKDQLTTLEAQIRAIQQFLDEHPGLTPWGFAPDYRPAPQPLPPGGGGGGGELEALRAAPQDFIPSSSVPQPSFAAIPAFSLSHTGTFAGASPSFAAPDFIRVPVPGGPGVPVGPLSIGNLGAETGGVRMEFNAPLVTFPDMKVDSEERAQFVLQSSYREVRRALAGFVNAGPPTFRG